MNFLKRSRVIDLCAIVFGIVYAAMVMTPVGHWYNVGDIAVRDAAAGQPLEIDYHGGAVRQFRGSYSVIVRHFGSRSIACEATSSPFTYEVDAQRPDPLTMDWWAPSDRRCWTLQPGTYVMETCWTVHSPFRGLVPAKIECVTSRDFTIHSV